MMAVAEVKNFGKFCEESWSSESEDLETPLDIWRKLFGNLLQGDDDDQNVSNSKETQCVTRRILKRKSRLRVPPKGAQHKSSSDSDSSQDLKKSRKTRSKTRARAKLFKITRKPDKSSKTLQNSDEVEIDEVFSEKEDALDATKTSTNDRTRKAPKREKKTRPLRRSTRNRRKNPIQFIDNDCSLSIPTGGDDVKGSDPCSDDDSQKTILLDTPDFENSVNFLNDKKEEGNTGHQPTVSITEDVDEDGIKHKLQTRSSEKPGPSRCVTAPLNTSRFSSLTFAKIKSKIPPVKQTSPRLHQEEHMELESTELDEIFFKSSNSPKKPPPSRLLKKSDKTTLLQLNTTDTPSTSLLDDDSLWNTK